VHAEDAPSLQGTRALAAYAVSGPGPRITIVHTSFHAVADLDALFAELGPEIALRHVVDDGLLPAVLDHGAVTPAVEARLLSAFHAAEEGGCDVVFSQCSSVGEVATQAAEAGLHVVKIDVPMAEHACSLGRKIGVIATLPTTLGPTCRLIEATAAALGQETSVEACVVEGAFDLLASGDREGHDRKVAASIRTLAQRVDVVVCAQGSMARVAERLTDLETPLLTSARTGVQNAIDIARRRWAAGPGSN
jgi:Asp/Glu/hydantoin racemase